MYRNQLVLFLSSAFWGPPSQCGRHLWKPQSGFCGVLPRLSLAFKAVLCPQEIQRLFADAAMICNVTRVNDTFTNPLVLSLPSEL